MAEFHIEDSDNLLIEGLTVDSELAEDLYVRGLIELTNDQVTGLRKMRTIDLPIEAKELVTSKAEGEWIEPLDAVHLLAPHVGGDGKAKLAIAGRLRTGSITCSCLWVSEGPDLGPLYEKRPTVIGNPISAGTAFWTTAVAERPGVRPLGHYFWAHSDGWERDQNLWNWVSGLFVTVRERSPYSKAAGGKSAEKIKFKATRMTAAWVRFRRADIESIAGLNRPDTAVVQLPDSETTAPAAAPSPKRGLGRKPDPRWQAWTAEVVRHIHYNGLEKEVSIESLITKIEQNLSDRGLEPIGPESAYKAIGLIRQRLEDLD